MNPHILADARASWQGRACYSIFTQLSASVVLLRPAILCFNALTRHHLGFKSKARAQEARVHRADKESMPAAQLCGCLEPNTIEPKAPKLLPELG